MFDPEWVGLGLMRLPGYRRSDFQHLVAWRRLTILGARAFGAGWPTVIVPMAFSELRYLSEVRSGLARSQRPVVHLCLTAPLEVVQERLSARGEPADDPRRAWVHRRAAECCLAHASKAFDLRVPTENRTVDEVVDVLVRQVRASE